MSKKSDNQTDYSSYIVRRQLEDYWRVAEKADLVLSGMHGRIPGTTLCKENNITPSLYYEWREKFLTSGKQELVANGGKTQRESELENKIAVLERCFGSLTLEKELLLKINDES